MTEAVQKHLEAMVVELGDMNRTKLFTADETRSILERRREMEYKIHAITKDLKCFTDYILYEKCLLKDIRLRRDKHRVGEKKATIEHNIIKRIKMLYEVALQLYSNDIPLFLACLKFCKTVNFINAASDVVSNMIRKHQDNPEIWLLAARWHAYDRSDPNTAMIMLLKGAALHKTNKDLYNEMVKIELLECNKTKQINENPVQQEICVKKLEKIVGKILENIDDCDFYLELLDVLEKHRFTMRVQDAIIECLMTKFSDNVTMWHYLALRERKDIYQVSDSSNAEGEGVESMDTSTPTTTTTITTTTTKKRTPKARLEACFAKYKQGLATVPQERVPILWELYLDFLIKLQQEPQGGATVLKMDTLKAGMDEASALGYLSEKHYMAWLDLVKDDNQALEIAEKGTYALPKSVDLWLARLRLQILKDVPSEVDTVFKLSTKALEEDGLPMWSSIMRYHYLSSEDHFIELIYEDSALQPKEISDTLKPQYLEWLALTKGIDETRDVYRRLAVIEPYCKEMHVMMSKLEAIQIHHNFEMWIEVHTLACEQFGKEDVDVWINYIQFYLQYHKSFPDLNHRVQKIRREALATIPKELTYLFETKYNVVTERA